MNIKNILKKAARFILSAGQQPVHIEIGTIAPSEMLSGRKIVITGGIRGIGFATAQACIKQGADVLIAGRKESTLQESAKKLGPRAHYLVFDVSKAEQAKDFIAEAKSCLGGGIDGLICNAGLSLHEESIGKVSPEQFDKQFNTNFRGAYFWHKPM
ncbi:hypothetical protein MCC00215_04640 [Bifidobacterium longum subsp. longum]|nr:hypothetical protein MCC00215_04640 [Bifidobacterium longum subsp. longum]